MTRTCDGCTMCCTALEIQELDKKAGQDCRHCTGHSCSIYELRPVACRNYRCAWLFNEAWPESLRPDLCGVMFEPCGDELFLANVDTARPDAWQHGAANAAIGKLLAAGRSVIVVIGDTKHVLLAEGVTPNMVWEQFEMAGHR